METGLRERKKRETRRIVADVAVRLFAERGFDDVTVAEVAEAAGVSLKTVFNYFPTKEELLLNGKEEVAADLLDRLKQRPPSASVLDVALQHTLDVADRIRAIPAQHRAAIRTVIRSTPSVQARWHLAQRRHEDALAQLLANEPGSDIVTGGIVAGVLGTLQRLALSDLTGWPDSKRRSPAVTRATIRGAFTLLGAGLSRFGVRR